MNFNAEIKDGRLSIAYKNKELLKNICLNINVSTRGNITFLPDSVENSADRINVNFRRDGSGFEKETTHARVIFTELDSLLRVDIDTSIFIHNTAYSFFFVPENTFSLKFEPADTPDAMLATSNDNPWWMKPIFPKSMSELSQRTENLCIKLNDTHVHLMPLINNSCSAKLTPTGLTVNLGKPCITEFNAPVMSISASCDPYAAVDNTFRLGKKLGTVNVALRDERSYPEIFEGFGFCTWNAFYSNVSSALIYEKLDELKEKGVKLQWLLIDDGWSQFTDPTASDGKQLLSFKENPERFPEGLKACIERIKSEFGVKYVGVWHAFTGYWHGIADGSEIALEHPDALTRHPDGRLFPAFDEEGSFKFWDAWHSYLAEQGVDFVKVDNQGSFAYKFPYIMSDGEGLRNQHTALERSVEKHFSGAIINCMGCTMQNGLCRPSSALNRSSDDFFPNRERGFTPHIRQNIYSALFTGKLQYCDFDMWWSKHESALQSSILRAISGGPVYVSDEIGATDTKYIEPLCDENGKILRVEGNPLPCPDNFYRDCANTEAPLKLFNRHGDKFIFAAYGLTPDKTVNGTFSLSDLPGASGRYAAQNYFTKEVVLLDDTSSISLSLSDGDVALYNVYPVAADGTVTLGNQTKYIGII